MRLSLFLLTLSSPVAAFVVREQQTQRPTRLSSSGMAFEPPLPGPIDMDRATFCAEHFGACPVEEMEEIHDNLHRERLQNFAFGGGSHAWVNPALSSEQMEHLVVEEELELQLNLLKDNTPDPTLFPHDMQDELPHLQENNDVSQTSTMMNDDPILMDDTTSLLSHRVEDAVHRAENAVAFQESVLQESNLETLAICGAVLAMVLLPQLGVWN